MPTTVEVTVQTNGNQHSLKVEPDPVEIPAGVKGPIQWKITNPAPEGWKFGSHGIDIRNGGSEFTNPHGGGGRVFTWNNNHNTTQSYKYSVRVTNGSASVELDPTIMNN
jgi:hypothetical protein